MFTDFDAIQGVLEKNLVLYSEAQQAQETYHTSFHEQMECQQGRADIMNEIQDLIKEEFFASAKPGEQEAFNQTSSAIQNLKLNSSNKHKFSKDIYSNSKKLKKITELITITKSVINCINERRAKVKQYVIKLDLQY